MLRHFLLLVSILILPQLHAQVSLSKAVAEQLAALPLQCISQEFPNKTSHGADSAVDAKLLPHELHPSFYGCYDWHSSVHGHWMLVRLLKLFPDLANKDAIINTLNQSFQKEKMIAEAAYFTKYSTGKLFERTYGWAWLLKLDAELATWDNPLAKRWHNTLQPLTLQIETLWKNYLPKQTYPNRTGVHPNTAFAMCFALDWANATQDDTFKQLLIQRAKDFYLTNEATPAYLEPDGTDFFSPSLEIADLMRRVLPLKEYENWLAKFYEERSLKRICELPIISDRSDYQIVHLDGLCFSRAWCMKGIAQSLPHSNPLKQRFLFAAQQHLDAALPQIFEGNYGGGHWLGSFAVYALE